LQKTPTNRKFKKALEHIKFLKMKQGIREKKNHSLFQYKYGKIYSNRFFD